MSLSNHNGTNLIPQELPGGLCHIKSTSHLLKMYNFEFGVRFLRGVR